MPDEIADFNTAQGAINPFDEVVESVQNNNRVKNEDDVRGLCVDCSSTQPEQSMYRSIFVQQGLSSTCRYCGGPVVICYGELLEETRAQLKRQRGIDGKQR